MSRVQKTTKIDNIDLPKDNTKVKAMTWGSIEYDKEPEEVVGILTTRPSPFGTPQCFVNNVQVNPYTVRPISTLEEENNSQTQT